MSPLTIITITLATLAWFTSCAALILLADYRIVIVGLFTATMIFAWIVEVVLDRGHYN
jgi:hypothetical protein